MDPYFFDLEGESPAGQKVAGKTENELDLTAGTCAIVWREL